jgi:hypothetical protein
MRLIFTALDHVAAYKDVRFVQVSSGGANLTFANIGYNIGTNVLMWTNGRTIYIPSTVNWGSWRAGMLGATKHEVGHAFGATAHNMNDAGLMRPSLVDPLQNWTKWDFYYWYNQLLNRSGIPMPWDEPNRWRTFAVDHVEVKPIQDGFGRPSLWRKIMHGMERYTVDPIVKSQDIQV